MVRPLDSFRVRTLVLASLALLPLLGSLGCDEGPLRPRPGRAEWRAPSTVRVPGGLLDAVSGNLLLPRRELSIDTPLGPYVFGSVWNSASRRWHFGFEASYRDGVFIDEAGARHSLAAVASGSAVPGTHWVKLDPRRLKTKGGIVHVFGLDGALEAIHFEGHPHPRLVFQRGLVSGNLRTTAIRQCAGPGDCLALLDLSWDGEGRLVAAVDRTGRRVEYVWWAPGLLASARDALACEQGRAGVSYRYDGDDLVGLERPEGERVEYVLDAQGRLLQARALGEGGLVFHASYRWLGGHNESRVEGPGGSALEWTADREGRVLEIRGPAPDEVRRLQWSGRRVSHEVSPDGVETVYQIVADEVVSVRRGDLPPRIVSHAPGAIDPRSPLQRPVASIHDGEGLVLARQYGADGLPASETDGAGDTTLLSWSGITLVRIERPDGAEMHFEDHGPHGHPRRTRLGGAVFQWHYDGAGNLLRGERSGISLAPGGEVARHYDAGRNLVEIELQPTHPLAPAETTASVHIERRSDGRMLAVRRPHGFDRTFHYDALGRLAETRVWRAGSVRSEWRRYDAAGHLVERELPNGMRTLVRRDGAGRPLLVSHWRGDEIEQAAAFGYRNGRLESVTDSVLGGRELYGYDGAGRLASIQHAGGERLVLAHDARSRLVRESFRMESGQPLVELEHHYDGADRLQELRRDGARLVAFDRDGGRVSRILHGPGSPAALTRTLRADPVSGLPLGSDWHDAEGGIVASSDLSWARDEIATTTLVATTRSHRGVLATTQESHRLFGTGASGPSGPRVVMHDLFEFLPRLHHYDELGNTLGDIVTRHAEYGPQRAHLLHIRDAWGASLGSFAWDEAGFATRRDGEPIVFDAAGRVSAIGERAGFLWDVRGRRVEQTLSGSTRVFRFGGRVACDAQGVPASLDLGHVVIGLDGREDRHRHFDFRGNVSLVSDPSGAVVTHLGYDPYGVAQVHGETPDRGFAGGLGVDPDLVLLGHRLLDSSVGRFLSPDPVLQLVNEYAYAQGNPILYRDPTGASYESVFAEFGGVAGSAAGATVGAGATIAYLNVAAFGVPAATAAAGGAVVGYWAGSRLGGFLGGLLDEALADGSDPATGPGGQPAPAPPPAIPAGPTPAPPSRGEVGRMKGCVGACIGAPRFHGPGLSLSGSAVSAPACAGPRFDEAPDLSGWLPLLVPLCAALTLACALPARPGRKPR